MSDSKSSELQRLMRQLDDISDQFTKKTINEDVQLVQIKREQAASEKESLEEQIQSQQEVIEQAASEKESLEGQIQSQQEVIEQIKPSIGLLDKQIEFPHEYLTYSTWKPWKYVSGKKIKGEKNRLLKYLIKKDT